jgi:hypothetical protein
MNHFQKFYILEKFDDFLGLATGVAAAEELDHDREIMDYAGSKPYFQQWSQSQFDVSKGKSKGNVRLQHDAKRPVGKLVDINFDDVNKKVRVQALIEDPVAKGMLASGTLTGFSVGGDYVKRTPLANGVVRYIAGPAEISVCDRPCMPSATFSAVKSDRTMELRKFRTVIQPQAINAALQMARQGFCNAAIQAALGISYHQVDKACGGWSRHSLLKVN